mmetsp:Transcript_35837/g.70503  ORF Transcript_35837/g.70503 Transcript_35837/m.70503 type:complete len:160 (+) Transcript_35837:49-528(+)
MKTSILVLAAATTTINAFVVGPSKILNYGEATRAHASMKAPFGKRATDSSGVALLATKFKSFDEMLCSFEKPVLVDFYATWCGPCQELQKELAVVGDECKDWLKVAKVDTDKYPALSDKYEVEGLPTMVLFKGGKPVHRMMGLFPASQIISQCQKAVET